MNGVVRTGPDRAAAARIGGTGPTASCSGHSRQPAARAIISVKPAGTPASAARQAGTASSGFGYDTTPVVSPAATGTVRAPEGTERPRGGPQAEEAFEGISRPGAIRNTPPWRAARRADIRGTGPDRATVETTIAAATITGATIAAAFFTAPVTASVDNGIGRIEASR